jgi:hypothetical protein
MSISIREGTKMKSFKYLLILIFSSIFLHAQKVSIRPSARPSAPKISIAQKCPARPQRAPQPRIMSTPAQRTQILAALQPTISQRAAFSAIKMEAPQRETWADWFRKKTGLGYEAEKISTESKVNEFQINENQRKLLQMYRTMEQPGTIVPFTTFGVNRLKGWGVINQTIPFPAEYKNQLKRHSAYPEFNFSEEQIDNAVLFIETNITPLKKAIKDKQAWAVKNLLEAGADPNFDPHLSESAPGYFSDYAHSPFIMALLENKPEIALLLLQHGALLEALPRQKDYMGRVYPSISALDYAKLQLQGQEKIIEVGVKQYGQLPEESKNMPAADKIAYRVAQRELPQWQALVAALEQGATPYDVD